MPELPEVDVLVRYLAPRLQGRIIRAVRVYREQVTRPTPPDQLERALQGARFVGVSRRGKFVRFSLRGPRPGRRFELLGHLGLTGRMYLLPACRPLPKHTAITLDLGRERFVFEDTRYFGRFTLDLEPLAGLGPEPLSGDFVAEPFWRTLRSSRQPLKVKLLDQSLLAGLGNIYASEALFVARLSPRRAAWSLTRAEGRRLWRAVRAVLRRAIRFGSTVPLDWSGASGDRLFYYGRAGGSPSVYEEKLMVYDRAGQPCRRCRTPIRRIVQAGRSTFYCPRCQR
jgi:formamidopyrimidine-DNA glycosylase